MGRSVSTPRNTWHTCYAVLDEDGHDDWSWLCRDFQREVNKAFPSMWDCDEWIGREDHALLENQFAYVGVSEYCGLVAMWVAEKELDWRDEHLTGLRDRWLRQIAQRFSKVAERCFGQALRHQGTFSNGEAFFQPVSGKQQGDLGLGFSSKEGWL